MRVKQSQAWAAGVLLMVSACKRNDAPPELAARERGFEATSDRFKPFGLDDLTALPPTRDVHTPVHLHGAPAVVMPAGEYLRQLNVLESALNAKGRSLRETGQAEQLTRENLSYVGPEVTFAPGVPTRDAVLQQWSSGVFGEKKVIAAEMGVKTSYECESEASVATVLRTTAWFADQPFTLLDLNVKARLKRPGTSDVAESVGSLTLFGKTIHEQRGNQFETTIPVFNEELVNRPIIKINVWNNVVFVSVSVRASATGKGGVVGLVSGRPSAEARSYLEASLVGRVDGTVDLGAIIQLGLTGGAELMKFKVSQEAAMVQQGVEATYSSSRRIDFTPASGALGGVACLDLTPIGLKRFCAEFIVVRWSALASTIDLGEFSGRCEICQEDCGNRCGIAICDGALSCQCPGGATCRNGECQPCNPCKCANGFMPEETCCRAPICAVACRNGGHGGKTCRN